MSRKLILLATVLGVAATACAAAPVEPSFGSGTGFAAAVVDPLNDAGRLSSVAVVDGRPVIAYVSFEEDVPEGSLPETRPIGLPSLPGIMLATVQDGIWTRGAIAIEKQINNVQVAFNPAFEETVASLTPANVTGLQLVADDGGMLHAVWGSADGLFYAMGTADPASPTQWEVEKVAETPPYGPSLALDGSGNPWIAYTTAVSTADLVVATKDGSSWTSEVAATGAGCDACRTGIAVDGDGAPVVAYGDGAGLNVVTPNGKDWELTYSFRDGSAIGLSATSMPDGNVAVSYETATEVQAASGSASGDWAVVPVADLGEGDSEGRTTGLTVDDQGWMVAWYDPGTGSVQAATSADGQAFAPMDLGNTTGAQSPSAATTSDGATRFVSWYDSSLQDLILGASGDLGEIAIAVPSPTPTEAMQPSAAPPSQECTPVENGTVTVVAEGIAYTDGICIEAPAGEPFTILFDNRDANVQHNIQVFEGPDVAGSPTFNGDLITGPSQIEYEIPALDAGEYAYNCLVHPNMVGKIVVGGGGGGATGPTGATGGGGGAAVTTTVVAQNIAFDTDTITLAADAESTITFDNRDAGVQHNIAIYSDSSMAEELFNGELITGPTTTEYTIPPLPAGEYYFVCIVHPNMNGTVVVQ
jgi:plastocyanin